jgi:hypothetical protein
VGLWNTGDFDAWLEQIGPDFEFTPDPSFPDAGTYRGEHFRRWLHGWIATWQENRFELLEIEELGPAVLIRGRWHLATPQSGRQVPLEDFSLVLFYRDNAAERPNRMAAYFDPERARQSALDGAG